MGAALAWLLCAAGSAAAQSSVIVDPQAATRFATVDIASPRALDANPQTGELFVGSISFRGMNALIRLDRSGKVVARLEIGSNALLAAALGPRDGKLYFTSGCAPLRQPCHVQRVPADFGSNTRVEDVAVLPDLPAPSSRVQMGVDGSQATTSFDNRGGSIAFGLLFRKSDGALLISDALQGAILRIDDPASGANVCPGASSCVRTVIQDGLLATANGAGPLGATGIALSADEKTLFIANSGDNRILSLALAAGARPAVFADGIDVPDGLLIGPGNTLFVVANRSNQILVLDAASGRTLAQLGAFLGVDADGAAVGLLDPAQVVRVGDSLFVTNFANGMRNPDIRKFTISRVRIPAALLPGATAAPR